MRRKRNDPDVRAFWTRHVALWMRGPFSQREYCERQGISRSLMSKWWIWLREDRAREERIKIARCRGRRRSDITNELSHRTYEGLTASPAALANAQADRPFQRRRRFSDEEKRHFLALANQPGGSVSEVAKRYDIALGQLFRWRKEFGDGPAPFVGFAEVIVTGDVTATPPNADRQPVLQATPIAHDTVGGMEIELRDGRRVRVEAGADPEAVRRLVALLEREPS